MVEMPLIRFRDVSKVFKGKEVLRKLDFSIRTHDFCVLAGANGSGKTVCFRLCLGLEKPDSGIIEINGRNRHGTVDIVQDSIGFVFQNPENQIIGSTVEDDIRFGLENHGKYRTDDQIREILDRSGLQGKASSNTASLSGGEKRRLALAGVLALNPKLLILDEPFNELDYPGVRQLCSWLIELHKQGSAIFLITHDVQKIAAHANRMMIISHGELKADGKTEEVFPLLEENHVFAPKEGPGSCSWL